MKTTIITAVFTGCVLALVLAAPLSAKDSHKDEFKAMDTNGDGKVSQTEHLDFSRSMFQLSDANRDSGVTAAEWDAAAAASGHGDDMKPEDTAAQLKIMDTDGDGKVSAAESDNFARSIFSQADKDADGLLTKSEYKAGAKELKKAKKQQQK